MSEVAKPSSEASQEHTLFGRVKQAVGLAQAPKEHKLDIEEHETSPREGGKEPSQTKAQMPFKESYGAPQGKEVGEPGGAFEGAEFIEAPPSSEEQENPLSPHPSLQNESYLARKEREEAEAEASRVGVQKLLKPQEVEVGMEKPQYSTSSELPPHEGVEHAQYGTGLQPIPEKTAASKGAPSPTPSRVSGATPQTPTLSSTMPTAHGQRGRRREDMGDMTSKVIADMEARGFKHVSGSEAASAAEFYEQQQQKQKAATTGEKEEPEMTQGERVQVSRFGAASSIAPGGVTTATTAATTTGAGAVFKKGGISGAAAAAGVQEVYARPDHEVTPMTGVEVAGMKAKEHASIAREAERRAAEKQKELQQLRRQAEELEKQSAVLFEEAEAERKRIELAQEKLEEIEQGEWRGYAQAERAEQQRRAVVARARPSVRTAEAREREAMEQKQLAADAQFHAQVLENRARSLLKESQDMAALSLKLSTEAARVNSQLMIVRQEAQELKAQIDTHAARGLPEYINECHQEIGALTHRITQLREEIAWAEGEMERGREEADTWRRVVVAKEGQAGRLLLQLTQLNESAEEARRRSKSAAEEARIPTELAEQKYDEAWSAAKLAEEAEAEAKEAQQEALETVKEAVEPEQERQRALREAAAAESAAIQLETKAGVVAGKAQRRLYEAEVKEKTAAAKTEEAEIIEADLSREREIQVAEEKISDTYTTQQKEIRPIPVPAI